MRVKIANPDNAAGLKDPHTRRSPFIDPETGKVIPEADVPESTHWLRRVRDGEIVRIDEPAPIGNEPIQPLTTRAPRK